jgi:tetratricopeptide (TPR) repeat protein
MMPGMVLSVAILAVQIQQRAVHDLIARGRYAEALPILEAARMRPGADLAPVLNELGGVYYELGRLRDAQLALEQSVEIRRGRGEIGLHALALTLNNLGMLYTRLNLLHKAEETIGQAVAIHRRLGDRMGESQSLLNLGSTYRAERRLEEAANLFRGALALREQLLDPSSRDVAVAANNLAVALEDLKRFTEAEPLVARALSIWEHTLGPKHPLVATALNNLGVLYTNLGRFREAEPRLARAVAIASEVLPTDHPDLAAYRNSYAFVLRKLDRKKEARRLEEAARLARARFERDNSLGLTVDARQSFR